MARYSIELWDTSGIRHAVAHEDTTAFMPWLAYQRSTLEVPPKGLVVDMVQQGDRLWVLLRVPKPDWYQGLEARTLPDGTRYYAEKSLGTSFDSILEVLDAESLELVASSRLESYFLGFAGPGKVISVTGGHDELVIAITPVRLVESNH
jgi:hypothetical protein